MNDIVKRLRDHLSIYMIKTVENGAWDLMTEAATRIEALEKEIDQKGIK